MKKPNRRALVVSSAVMTAAVLAACSSGGEGNRDPAKLTESPVASPSAAARPTLTAPNLQPPLQDNKYTKSSSRPKVVVDPCTWVADSAIQEAGFDPGSRRRGSDVVAENIFLTCNFKQGEDAVLALESGNVTLDEVRKKYPGDTEELIINGRLAVKSKKDDSSGCSIDLQTNAGYFGITVRTHTSGRTKGMQSCDNIVEIATVLEPSIGKEN
ncbi:DUF3558 domain-containing protein [Nocardia sp. NPDC058658]|uniref:DUF3558 domain-containing protein n=1 Tax=Nocardia sp. NPDC058658 TaxID=3346580 RepID=UPI003653D190